MVITEQDAKLKWCPFVRVMNKHGDGGGNRWDNSVKEDSPNNSLCIGSACMVWRWEAGASVADGVNGKRKGYCGLAGGAQ